VNVKGVHEECHRIDMQPHASDSDDLLAAGQKGTQISCHFLMSKETFSIES
jgi:hypothetical protein